MRRALGLRERTPRSRCRALHGSSPAALSGRCNDGCDACTGDEDIRTRVELARRARARLRAAVWYLGIECSLAMLVWGSLTPLEHRLKRIEFDWGSPLGVFATAMSALACVVPLAGVGVVLSVVFSWLDAPTLLHRRAMRCRLWSLPLASVIVESAFLLWAQRYF